MFHPSRQWLKYTRIIFLISIEKAHLLQADVNCNSFMILYMTEQIHLAYTYQVFISLIAHSLRNKLKHVAHLKMCSGADGEIF